MFNRYMPALAIVLLVSGLGAGILGLLGDNPDVWAAGVFTVLAALPLLILRTVRNSQTLSAHQLAEAENAGYRQAMDHVARGLLDPRTAPKPGPGDRATDEQAAGNVIPLRPDNGDREDRQAL